MIKRYFYPKISQAILLISLTFVISIFASVVLGIIFIEDIYSPSVSIWSLIISSACTLLTALFGIYRSKTPLKSYFNLPYGDKRNIFYSFILFIGVYLLLLIIGDLLERIVPMPQELTETYIHGFYSIPGIISMVVLAPLFEETLFRGVILRGFLKNYGVLKSIIITSALFGLLHFNFAQTITTAIAGMVLAWIFVKTGSLWVSIFFHALNNSFSVVIYHLSIRYQIINEIDGLWFLLPGIVLTALGVFLLTRKPDRLERIYDERQRYLENLPPESEIPLKPEDPAKHSGFGIASFIISIVAGFIEFTAIIVAGIMATLTENITQTSSIAIGLVIIFSLFLNLTGIGLGIAGLTQKNKKKIFSILGLVFNSFIILLLIVLMIIGFIFLNAMPLVEGSKYV